jgi:predicted dehydrogenase
MVGHTFVYNSSVIKLKEIIDTKDIGQIYYLYATRTNMGPIREDVNAVWDLAPHDISIFTYLLNEFPDRVNAVGSCYLKHELCDVAYINLHFPSGVICNVHVSWIDPFKVRHVIMVGSKMRILFNDLDNLEPIRIYHKGVESNPQESSSFGQYKLLMRDGDIHIPKIEASEPLRNQMSIFGQAIKTGQPITSDGVFGHKIVCVLEAVQESLKNDGVPVNVKYH